MRSCLGKEILKQHGKHLTNFKTKEEYEAFKASGEYITPNVSFIETAGSVINDSYQVQGGNSVIYLDIAQIIPAMGSNAEMLFSLMPGILAVKEPNKIMPSASFIRNGQYESIGACAILSNFRGTVAPGNDINSTDFIDQLKQMGAFEITKEEFYKIAQPIDFYYDDEPIAKEVYEILWNMVKSEQENSELLIPTTEIGYTSINEKTHIYKYSLNETFYSSNTEYYVEGEGTCDMIYLCYEDGTSWTNGVCKIYLNDGTIRYSWFSMPV